MKRLGQYEGLVRLILLLVILPLVIYHFSLARTYRLWKKMHRTEQLIAQASQESPQFVTAVRLDSVELIASGEVLDRMKALFIDDHAKIIQYTPWVTQEGDDFTLRTAEIVLSGDFTSLLQILDKMEQDLKRCRFLCSEFRIVRRGRQSSLQLAVIVQQLIDKS